jgi:hypothetical protein
MTVIFERPLAGPVTRALVLGIGSYPFAQDPTNPVQVLRAVPENLSSATSAAMFTDWLISNADRINPPLASIDLLLCAVAPGAPRGTEISSYMWRGRVAAPADAVDPRPDATTEARVSPPTSVAFAVAGKAWLDALKARLGSHALFYGCGHGTNLPGKSMLLLQDLNVNAGDPWSAHFDVSHHAFAFDQIPEIGRATFFLDACAENLDVLRRMPPGNGVRLANYFAEQAGDRKVYALAAAAAPSVTFEGVVAGSPDVKAGRFTQCLMQALDGAAIRLLDGMGTWGVPPIELKGTIAQLYLLRDDWEDKGPLRPAVIEEPVELWSIVTPAAPIMVPLCVGIIPESDTPHWGLAVYDHEDSNLWKELDSRPAGAFSRWVARVPVATQRYALVANRKDLDIDRKLSILPTQALFDLRVPG